MWDKRFTYPTVTWLQPEYGGRLINMVWTGYIMIGSLLEKSTEGHFRRSGFQCTLSNALLEPCLLLFAGAWPWISTVLKSSDWLWSLLLFFYVFVEQGLVFRRLPPTWRLVAPQPALCGNSVNTFGRRCGGWGGTFRPLALSTQARLSVLRSCEVLSSGDKSMW